MYIESGLNYIQVGTLLDLEDYLTSRHEYIIADGTIYEKLGLNDIIKRREKKHDNCRLNGRSKRKIEKSKK